LAPPGAYGLPHQKPNGAGPQVLGADLNRSESRFFTPACGAPSTDVGVRWAPCRETQARLEFRVLAPG
jgi:hypothetical protein